MKKKIIFFIVILLSQFIPVLGSISNKIIVNVGTEIVTSYELKNKIKIILFLSGQELTQNNIDRAKKASLTSLINYKIKKQEVKRNKINVSKDKNVEQILRNLSDEYNTNEQGLIDIFKQNNLDFEAYLEEVKIEMAWQKLVYRLYINKINLNEDDINKEISKTLSLKREIENYELAEIEIEFDNEINKLNKIKVITDKIEEIGFENTALNYSIAPSAPDKGKIGWISSNSLSKNILKEIQTLKLGEVSEPIIKSNSILIYKLLNSKKINVSNINENELKKNIINREKNQLLNLYSSNHLSKLKNSVSIIFK